MIKNTIFVFIILLSVLFTCENSNLIKKSFLHQVNLKAASMESNKIETSNNNSSSSKSDSDQDAICSEAKDYINLMMDVEVSLQELMTAFEDHLKDIRSFKNSTDVESEKDKWQLKERDIVDYYVNKTAELLDVYVNLNNTINQNKTTYCAPKVVPVTPSNNSTNTLHNNTSNPTNNTTTNTTNTDKNGTSTNTTNNTTNTVQNNTSNNTSNNTANTVQNNTSTNSTNITNTVQNNTTNSTPDRQSQNTTSNNTNTTQQNDNSNKETQNGNTININYDTNTKKEEMIAKPPKVDDDTSSSGSQSNVITIFTERLQAAASEAGLPGNYVQTRLREIRENKMKSRLQRNMRRLRH